MPVARQAWLTSARHASTQNNWLVLLSRNPEPGTNLEQTLNDPYRHTEVIEVCEIS